MFDGALKLSNALSSWFIGPTTASSGLALTEMRPSGMAVPISWSDWILSGQIPNC